MASRAIALLSNPHKPPSASHHVLRKVASSAQVTPNTPHILTKRQTISHCATRSALQHQPASHSTMQWEKKSRYCSKTWFPKANMHSLTPNKHSRMDCIIFISMRVYTRWCCHICIERQCTVHQPQQRQLSTIVFIPSPKLPLIEGWQTESVGVDTSSHNHWPQSNYISFNPNGMS